MSETHACAPCAAAAYDTEEDMAWRLRFEDLESKLRNELNSKPYTSKERPD